ncbi:hypothetical protein HZH68_007194 [Vespula germanica]|uniref:Uncharacterized protein n=1 Tax=Vespula germanica TaxID=30212 RepID=A0A834NAV5_VESGE|nr:hypothetical protein HZH68_007194 [Vespula germanica]
MITMCREFRMFAAATSYGTITSAAIKDPIDNFCDLSHATVMISSSKFVIKKFNISIIDEVHIDERMLIPNIVEDTKKEIELMKTT